MIIRTVGLLGRFCAAFVALGVATAGLSGCCSMGKNKTSWETTDTVGDAYVEVNRYLPNGDRDVANVRDKPGQTGTRVTAQLTHGTKVRVYENTKLADGYWSKVHFDVMGGGDGWMHQDVLNKQPQGGGNGFTYRTRISANDRVNSSGAPLNDVGMILQQDRANFHKFNRRDADDAWDPVFSDQNERGKIAGYLNAVPNDVASLIRGGSNPLIQVTATGSPGSYRLSVSLISR